MGKLIAILFNALFIVLFILFLVDHIKTNRQISKLKIGNKYKLNDDNYTSIVEITELKIDYNKELYVTYKRLNETANGTMPAKIFVKLYDQYIC